MMSQTRRLPVFNLLFSVMSVGVSFILGIFLQQLQLSEFFLVATLSVFAGTISCFLFRTPLPFTLLSLCIPLGVYLLAVIEMPPWILFTIFIFLFSLHLPAVWTHVPYYPTPVSVDDSLIELFNSNSGYSTFVDLGCGNGRLLSKLATKFPEHQFFGYEISVLPFLIAKVRTISQKNVQIHFASFWSISLSNFDIIYAFLSPAVMQKLGEKVKKEKSGKSIFVSNSFHIPESAGIKVHEVKHLGTERGEVLFHYI
jgi:hypothetical protein